MNTDVLDTISTTGSKLEKQRLLSTLDDVTVNFLRWALDPMITFGVTVDAVKEVKECSLSSATTAPAVWWARFNILLGQLSRRELTGNAAQKAIRDLMWSSPHLERSSCIIWACRVLNKDLRAGFSVSTLNKAKPGTIAPFACSLATPYDPDKHELKGAWCVEPKLDGLRMIVIDGVAYTRNGRVIESVGHILKELEDFKDGFVFDGEVMGETEFNEDSGKIRKKGEGPNLTLRYNAFDCIRRDEWFSRKTRSLRERKKDLLSCLGFLKNRGWVNIVEWVELENPSSQELSRARDEMISKKFEGAMAKDLEAPYIFKRSPSLLKFKRVLTADGRIVGSYEGEGRHEGRLGGFEMEFTVVCDDGVERTDITRVGGGFSDKERDDLWKVRKTLVDRMGEAEYQNSPDGVLRFPVWIRFRPDKDKTELSP